MKINKMLVMKREHDVHISQLCLIQEDYNTLLQLSEDCLHHKEIQRLNQFPSLARKHSYLLGRFSAKHALKEMGQQNLTKVHIANGIFEQPILRSNPDNLSLSISHSQDIGAALIFREDHPMAIDLEHIYSCNQISIFEQLLPSELEYVDKYKELPIYTILWTAREALAKVLKTGMLVSPDILAIDYITKNDNIITSTYKNFYQYKALSLLLADEFVLTIICPKNTVIDLKEFISESNKNFGHNS